MKKGQAWQAVFAMQAHEAYDRLWWSHFARHMDIVPEERGIAETREQVIRAQIRADYAANPEMLPVPRTRWSRLRKRKVPTLHSTPTVASPDRRWWCEETQPDPHATQQIGRAHV